MRYALTAALLVFLSTPLFAGADLSLTAGIPSFTVVSGSSGGPTFNLRNRGPDDAKDVVLTVTATGGVLTRCETGCLVRDTVVSGDQRMISSPFGMEFDNPGVVTITATVTSSTPDPDPSNNQTTITVTVSPDPDLVVRFFSVPRKADLGLPFSLLIDTYNDSNVVAHDVDVVVSFRPDVGVKSLPDGCSSPEAGRIVCHTDALQSVLSAYLRYSITLIAPQSYGDGKITFALSATESEQDYDPKSNTATALTAIVLPILVTSTANDGSGSLRQAILDANAATASGATRISFHIDEPSANKWKTIRLTSPLPALTAANIEINGATQSGAANPDGPDIEINGGGTLDGDGLTIEGCNTTVANLAINGFGRNGISVVDAHHSATCSLYPELHHLFIGTDPTGSEARPNGRGIGISVPNGTTIGANAGALIHDCVVSGNVLSGIFALSGFVTAWGNRIGVKAHSDDPLPNGGSGIFIGAEGWGSAIGADAIDPVPGNVIAFNGQMGVAIAAGVKNVSVRGNRIWNNGLLGIDIGLDGPTMSTEGAEGVTIPVPTLTLAHYDPVLKKTVVEGETPGRTSSLTIDLYANDAADPSGFGEGQRPVGTSTNADFTSQTHFRMEVDGDLTGQLITATATNNDYVGAAKPLGFDQGFLTQTSEFSMAIEVR